MVDGSFLNIVLIPEGVFQPALAAGAWVQGHGLLTGDGSCPACPALEAAPRLRVRRRNLGRAPERSDGDDGFVGLSAPPALPGCCGQAHSSMRGAAISAQRPVSHSPR
jgi:hypothetical protein